MARKRMLDPSIWQDDGMAELTPRQQLLYIALFSNADDEGRLKGSPTSIRLIVPTVYAGVSLDDISSDLEAVLSHMRQLVLYDVGESTYLEFENYAKWQRIDRPQPSNLPPPPSDPGHDPSPSNRRTIDESSSNDRRGLDARGEESRGTEQKGREQKRTAREADAIARYTALEPDIRDRIENFQSYLPDSFALTHDTRMKIADRFMTLDLELEGPKIAGHAKRHPRWITDGSVLAWLGRSMEGPQQSDERRAGQNARVHTSRQQREAGSGGAGSISEFAAFDRDRGGGRASQSPVEPAVTASHG